MLVLSCARNNAGRRLHGVGVMRLLGTMAWLLSDLRQHELAMLWSSACMTDGMAGRCGAAPAWQMAWLEGVEEAEMDAEMAGGGGTPCSSQRRRCFS
jgi:hypothetical protein